MGVGRLADPSAVERALRRRDGARTEPLGEQVVQAALAGARAALARVEAGGRRAPATGP